MNALFVPSVPSSSAFSRYIDTYYFYLEGYNHLDAKSGMCVEVMNV